MFIELELTPSFSRTVKTYEPSIIIHNAEQLVNHVREWSMVNGFANHYHAIDIMKSHKPGLRRDKKTPAYLHETLEDIYAIALIEARVPIQRPELLATLILFHDLKEDVKALDENKLMDVLNEKRQAHARMPFAEMRDHLNFLETLAQSVKVISKKSVSTDGTVIKHYDNDTEYYKAVFADEYAGPAKLIDILQNASSSNGIHTPKYITEKIEFFDTVVKPLVERAKADFPHHTELYDCLVKEIDLINSINSLKGQNITREIVDALTLDSPFEKLPLGIRPAHVALERHIRNTQQDKKDYQQIFTDEALPLKVRSLIL